MEGEIEMGKFLRGRHDTRYSKFLEETNFEIEGQNEGMRFSNLPKVIKEEIFCYLSDQEIAGLRMICREWKKIIDGSQRKELAEFQRLQIEERNNYDKSSRLYNSVSDIIIFHNDKTTNYSCSCCLGSAYLYLFAVSVACVGFVPCMSMIKAKVLGARSKWNKFDLLFSLSIVGPLFFLFLASIFLSFALMYEAFRLMAWIFTLGYFSPCRKWKNCHFHFYIHNTRFPKWQGNEKRRKKKYYFSLLSQEVKLDLVRDYWMSWEFKRRYLSGIEEDPQPCWVGFTFCFCQATQGSFIID